MCQSQAIQEVLQLHPREPGELVQLLQDMQKRLCYLPREGLQATASHLGVPVAKVYSVATFYKAFSLVPRGKHLVRVCTGTACHVRGAGLVVDELRSKLQVQPGETTVDKRFTLELVNCVGACAMAPVVMVDNDVHGSVTPSKAFRVVERGSQHAS